MFKILFKNSFSNYVLATTVYSTFSSKTTFSFCFINFARNRRRLQNVKLKRLNENVMTICPERRTVNYENLE